MNRVKGITRARGYHSPQRSRGRNVFVLAALTLTVQCSVGSDDVEELSALERHSDLREVIDQTTLGARPIPETVASNVVTFDVEVLQGDTWTSSCPTAHDAPAKAVRVSCRWADSTDVVSRTFQVAHGR